MKERIVLLLCVLLLVSCTAIVVVIDTRDETIEPTKEEQEHVETTEHN